MTSILHANQPVYVHESDDTGVIVSRDDNRGLYRQPRSGDIQSEILSDMYRVKFTEYTDTSPYDACYNTVESYKWLRRDQIAPVYDGYVRLGRTSGYEGMRGQVKERKWSAETKDFNYLITIPESEFPCHPMDYLPTDVTLWLRGSQIG